MTIRLSLRLPLRSVLAIKMLCALRNKLSACGLGEEVAALNWNGTQPRAEKQPPKANFSGSCLADDTWNVN
jgi:hypothetical protein